MPRHGHRELMKPKVITGQFRHRQTLVRAASVADFRHLASLSFFNPTEKIGFFVSLTQGLNWQYQRKTFLWQPCGKETSLYEFFHLSSLAGGVKANVDLFYLLFNCLL